MDITNLEVDCAHKPCIKVWAKCETPEDVDDIIAWLRLAKDLLIKWEKIRGRHAKAPRAPKTPAGKDEDHQSRQVQGEPQGNSRPHRKHSEQANAIGGPVDLKPLIHGEGEPASDPGLAAGPPMAKHSA